MPSSLLRPPRRCSWTSTGRVLITVVVVSCSSEREQTIPTNSVSTYGPSTTPTKTDERKVTPTGVAKFAAGGCIMAKDGYIWKITRIEGGKYFSMGWQHGGWGNEVAFEIGHFEKLEYQSCPCPELQPP